MLGSAVGVAEGRIYHDHPFGTGIVHIDVVDADTGPGDHLEARAGVQQGLVDSRTAACDDHVILADDSQQFLFFQAEFHIQLDTRFLGQKGKPFRRYFIGYDNLHCCSLKFYGVITSCSAR